MFYFIRDAAYAYNQKMKHGTWRGTISNPIGSFAEKAVDVAVHGTKAIAGEPSKKKGQALKFLDAGAQTVLAMRGIPYYTPKKILKKVLGLDKKEEKKGVGFETFTQKRTTKKVGFESFL